MEEQKTELKMIRMSEVAIAGSEVAVVSIYTIWKADNHSG